MPALLRPLFWDHRGRQVGLDTDRDFVVRRVLAEGSWGQIRLLRRKVGDEKMREVLLASRARGLSPARIRFFELLLDLPAARANAWVRAARAGPWARRRPA